jgi:8-oxo-dGTP pyrophosphatase MutT (NUDIX family)
MRESTRYGWDDPAMVGSSEPRAAWHHISPIHVDELADVKREFFQLTALEPDALDRSALPGHLTASACLFDHDATHVLLLEHTKLKRWLQPGGHADGEANLARVALTEAWEETGIENLEIVDPAIDLDIHNVAPTGQEPILHFDVRFLVLAPEGAQPNGNHESTDIRWVPFDELESYDLDPGTHRMIAAGRALAAELHAGAGAEDRA